MTNVERNWEGPGGVFRSITQHDRDEVAALTERSPEVQASHADGVDLAIARELVWREYMTKAEVCEMDGQHRVQALSALLWSLGFVHHFQPWDIRDHLLLEGHVSDGVPSALWNTLLPHTDPEWNPAPCLTAVVIEALPRSITLDEAQVAVRALPALPMDTPSPNPTDPLTGPWGEWVELARKRVLSASISA